MRSYLVAIDLDGVAPDNYLARALRNELDITFH